MAQDFHAAFGLDGADEKHISIIDEGGVALAAIHGLNDKLESQAKTKELEIETLKQENKSLEQKLSNLTAMVKAISRNQ